MFYRFRGCSHRSCCMSEADLNAQNLLGGGWLRAWNWTTFAMGTTLQSQKKNCFIQIDYRAEPICMKIFFFCDCSVLFIWGFSHLTLLVVFAWASSICTVFSDKIKYNISQRYVTFNNIIPEVSLEPSHSFCFTNGRPAPGDRIKTQTYYGIFPSSLICMLL